MKPFLAQVLELSRRTSLKLKIATLISVLVLGLTVGFAAFLLYHLKGQLERNIHQQQFALVTAMAGNIDDKLNLAQQSLLSLSRQCSADFLVSAAAQDFLDRHEDQLAIFDQGIFLFNAKGDLLAEFPPLSDRRGLNFGYRDYFRRTLASGRPVISEPYFSSKNGHPPAIMFTAPIHDGEGNLIAVLGGAMKLLGENFLAQISRTRVGETGYVYLYNDQRTLILHPDPRRILQQDVPPGANQLFDRAIEGFEGTGVTVNSRGLTVLASFKRLKTTNWIMAANYPIAEAYASVRQAENWVIGSLAPLGVLILAGALFTLQRQLRPLVQLTDQVRALTQVPADQLQPELWKNEISLLSDAFQAFVAQQAADRAGLLEEKNRVEAERVKTEAIIAAIGDGLNIIDPDFRLLYLNRTSKARLGDISGQFCYQAIHQLETPCPDCPLIKTFRDGEIHVAQHSARLDGESRHFELTVAPLRDAEGRIVAGIELVRDITERWLANEQLRILSAAVEQSPICIVITDPQARIEYVNPHFTKLTGYQLQEVRGQNPRQLASGHTPRETYRELWQAITAKSRWQGEFQNRKKNGELYWEQALVAPICDGSGTVTHLMAMKADITARKRAEAQIRKLSLAVEQSPALIMITDPAGRIEYINPKYAQVSGYAPEELAGRRAAELGEQASAERKTMWRTIAAGAEWKGEFRNRKKSGEWFWESAAIAPVKDQAGGVTHFVKVSEDITERRAMELQLRHAQKMEAIGQLAAGVAHDFNNLLTAIIGYASIQQFKAEEGSTLKADLAGILTAANRGSKLTRDLLAFSRKSSPEQGGTHLQMIDLNDLVRRSSDLLRRMLGETIDLVVQLAPGHLPLRANDQHLEQALLNLGANARDAMAKGGRLCLQTESVRLEQRFVARHGYGAPGRYAVLTLTDSGCGMDQETIRRIFDPFFTTKSMDKGTGLGLSITYGIVKQHQGYITCHSRPGQGTTFRIFLPIAEADDQNPECLPGNSAAGERETILLAEGDETARAMVRTLLEDLGYLVMEAGNGREALQLFTTQRKAIDGLILDPALETSTGVPLVGQILALAPEARMVCCSGLAAESVLRKGLIPAETQLLAKPFLPHQLLAKLREVLDQ